MNVYVLHESATIAAITGAQKPACDSLALATDDPSDVSFCFVGDNPLGAGWLIDNELPSDQIACWSGTLAEGPDLFAPHPHNWMNPGRESLDAFLDEMIPQLQKADRRLTLIPHARHVLSDVQGSINLVRERPKTPVGVALAPTLLLTPSMIDVVEDHYTREPSRHWPALRRSFCCRISWWTRMIPNDFGRCLSEKGFWIAA